MLRIIIFSAFLFMANSAWAQVWATAISENESEGKAIIYRFVKEFRKGFARSSQPDRVIIVWRYQGKKGMPSLEERGRMDTLEDTLALAVEEFSTLALVSTGDNLKEWTYYTRKEDEFLERLNLALRDLPRFPIEIHAAPDPSWTTYERFAAGLTE